MRRTHRRAGVRSRASIALVGMLLAAMGGVTACSASDDKAASSGPVTLRLGYFPNVTHATALVGVEQGIFAKQLGQDKLETKIFNAGPTAVEALFSGAVDAIYVGPNPTVNAWVTSKGKAVKVVAGAASGGAALVVKPSITSAEQLRGKKLATPQLGNTQDVALRFWLKQQGLTTTKDGGGDVAITPQENATTVDGFVSGAIDGAWVPEPYVTRLVAAGGKVLIDERDQWPGGKFVVTNLVVNADFLAKHRETVKRLLAGSVEANAYINANQAQAQQTVISAIAKVGGKPLDPKLLDGAWKTVTFTDDPLADSLRTGAEHAQQIGLLGKVDLKGIYELDLLNEVLKGKGQPEVRA